MSESNSRWCFMNPMEWLKSLYETFGGPKHPTVLLVGAIVVGGILGAVACLVAANEYKKAQLAAPAPTSINATAGSQSPIIPNNRGNVTINGGTNSSPPPPPPKDKKPK